MWDTNDHNPKISWGKLVIEKKKKNLYQKDFGKLWYYLPLELLIPRHFRRELRMICGTGLGTK